MVMRLVRALLLYSGCIFLALSILTVVGAVLIHLNGGVIRRGC